MRKTLFLIFFCVLAGAARASPTAFHPGTGVPNVIGGSRDVNWSEPPDLNGLIGSSEVINSIGLSTEIANDFVPSSDGLEHATWWGGFWNVSTPCQSGITTPGFNLAVYYDEGCTPGVALFSGSFTAFGQQSVGCEAGSFPLFQWDAEIGVGTTAGNPYWFSAQMMDHAFPPQSGRLAAGLVTRCDSVFRGAIFGFPDWTPAIDAFGLPYDASQEFQGSIVVPNEPGACCIAAQGECRILTYGACHRLGGEFQGEGVACDPNPCDEGTSDVSSGPGVKMQGTTWGKIKGDFR